MSALRLVGSPPKMELDVNELLREMGLRFTFSPPGKLRAHEELSTDELDALALVGLSVARDGWRSGPKIPATDDGAQVFRTHLVEYILREVASGRYPFDRLETVTP